MKKRILFVDDEGNVLKGLERMLHTMRKDWEMHFVDGGEAALALLEKETFDVIVTDMRMPGMDGAQLLDEVTRRYPQIIRFILSGQCDKETLLRSVGPAHQFMSKPCSSDMLRSSITRACALRELLQSPAIIHLVSKVQSLPSLPENYQELLQEIRAEEPSIKKIGLIIEKDLGMSAKVLQVVNSAFFGVNQHISSPAQAATLLGLDILRSLVLLVHIFSAVDPKQFPTSFPMQTFWQHSLRVGRFAQEITRLENAPKSIQEDALTAGLLHEAGSLILAAHNPVTYEKLLQTDPGHILSLDEMEREHFGAGHAEVGAYLLGLWGLSDPVVEAVAYHHNPSKCPGTGFSPLVAVHAADVFDQEFSALHPNIPRPKLFSGYLKTAGLEDRIGLWKTACLALKEEGAKS